MVRCPPLPLSLFLAISSYCCPVTFFSRFVDTIITLPASSCIGSCTLPLALLHTYARMDPALTWHHTHACTHTYTPVQIPRVSIFPHVVSGPGARSCTIPSRIRIRTYIHTYIHTQDTSIPYI
ncbi:hypothetical protein F4824DRAFT_478629 [Ustulina deusta]|nr:hypothetical protein F4824DRAFT_478629 [Ustulina deusta]